MRNLYAILFMGVLVFSACERTDLNPESAYREICQTSNPAEYLAWLKELSEQNAGTDYCSPVNIKTGKYNNQPVFIVTVSGALCCRCAGNAVYDCQGDVVFVCDPEEEKKIKAQKVVWTR